MDLWTTDLPDDVGDPPVPEPGQTPPPARALRTHDRIDLEEWGAATPPRTSRRWLLVAAVVPWVVVVAIMLTGGRGRAPTAQAGGIASDTAPTASPTPTMTPSATSSDASGSRPPDDGDEVARGGDTVLALSGEIGPSTRGQAEGVAIVVTRSWLSARPPGPGVDGLEPAPGAESRYVEHVAVESVDHPARGALVVTVRAVVLPVEGDSYGQAHQLRVAVPLTIDADHARPAGVPWLLPVDPPAVTLPQTAPVDDVDLQVTAAEAVTAAGYRDVSLTRLERTSGWAWVAVVEARAPTEQEAREHALWLRSDVGRLVVAGTAPPPPAAPPTAGTPTDTPSEPDTETTP